MWLKEVAIPYASVNGIEMYYEVHGEGPTLAFGHGGAGNHAIWYHQITYFSQWYQVVSYDARGYGLSQDSPGGPGGAAAIDDFEGLLDHLEVRKAALVGQSRGGTDMVGFTARHPDRVSALVLTGTIGDLIEPEPMARQREEDRKHSESYSQLQRLMTWRFPQRNPEQANLFLLLNSFNATNFTTLRAAGAPGGLPVGVPRTVTFEQLAATKVPILWLVGTEDALMSVDVVRMGHELTPGSSLVLIPDAAHSSYWERPDAFNYAVHDFFQKAGFGGVERHEAQMVGKRA